MRYLLIASLLASGCGFYGDDDDCDYGGFGGQEAEGLEAPTPQTRNPDTGQCDSYQLPSECSCDACGNCPPCAQDPVPPPDWAWCQSECSGLDETTCLATEGCRGAYLTACLFGGADCPDEYVYYGCWATAPSGVIRGGDCTALDAYQCSRHDDCVVRHVQITDCIDCSSDPTVGSFESCAPEEAAPAACAALDEAACVERADCSPYYEGVDCTCEGDVCECAEWVFQGCE